jgi:hypothetical protein
MNLLYHKTRAEDEVVEGEAIEGEVVEGEVGALKDKHPNLHPHLRRIRVLGQIILFRRTNGERRRSSHH